MVLGTIAEHFLLLTMAPVLVELARNLATDKVSGMKPSRTAATYKMLYGLGTFSERMFTNIRKWPFYINESTSTSNKKVCSMLVSY